MRMLILLMVLASCGSTTKRTCVEPSGTRTTILGVEHACSSYGCYVLDDTYCVQRPTQGDRL
jgi:hypothetical protein